MKKQLFVCIVSLLVIIVSVTGSYAEKTEKVTISVINDVGSPIKKFRFTMKIENQTKGHIEIVTDDNGQFQIANGSVGKKLQLTSFGMQCVWTEIKATNTIVKCEHKEAPMIMVNPWGHSRASSSR